jgi:hypothetical protein
MATAPHNVSRRLLYSGAEFGECATTKSELVIYGSTSPRILELPVALGFFDGANAQRFCVAQGGVA